MDEAQIANTEDSNELPPGYRFYPTEEELLSFYLHNKLHHIRVDRMQRFIPLAQIYHFDPWQLPPMSGEACVKDSEQWFFFCPMQEKEARGGRQTRTTPSGYWKATGSPSLVYSSADGKPIGRKTIMVFYRGRSGPNGTKTKWKMNEYRALQEQGSSSTAMTSNSNTKVRREFSLCRVYVKSSGLRSFDRRPSANPPTTEEAMPSDGDPRAFKRRKSYDSSSPEDTTGGETPPTGGATDLKILKEIEWFLESE